MTKAADVPETRPRPAQNDERVVVNRVFDKLGRPTHLYRANAEKLWGNQYRVNLDCAESTDHPVPNVRMTDSFFVTLTEDDISSVPPIVRRY